LKVDKKASNSGNEAGLACTSMGILPFLWKDTAWSHN
jgi:hypothetical protein